MIVHMTLFKFHPAQSILSKNGANLGKKAKADDKMLVCGLGVRDTGT